MKSLKTRKPRKRTVGLWGGSGEPSPRAGNSLVPHREGVMGLRPWALTGTRNKRCPNGSAWKINRGWGGRQGGD